MYNFIITLNPHNICKKFAGNRANVWRFFFHKHHSRQFLKCYTNIIVILYSKSGKGEG